MSSETLSPERLTPSASVHRLRRKPWTLSYFVFFAILFCAVYQSAFISLSGEWFMSANEAYLVALVVPLFWEVIAPSTMANRVGFNPVKVRVVWYGTFLIALLLLEGPVVETVTGSRLSQGIITLRDVVVGLLGLSLYFDWSRGLWRARSTGVPRLVSARARGTVFVLLLAANIAIFQNPVSGVLGAQLTTWLDFHAEAFAVMFFIPIYFDLVLHFTSGDPARGRAGPITARSFGVVGAALAVMGFFVWFGQGAATSAFDNSFGQWFVRSAEAPLGAIGVILYFEILRRLDRRRSNAAQPSVQVIDLTNLDHVNVTRVGEDR